MTLLLISLAAWLAGGCLALIAPRPDRLGPIGSVLGAVAALLAALVTLYTGQTSTLHWAWHIPLGSFALGLDVLSAWFVLPLSIMVGAAAVYGGAYLHRRAGTRNAWASYQFLAAAMLLVFTARNGLLFLLAWEVMALASFLLVMMHAEQPATRRAGWMYLVASHLGAAALFAAFCLLARGGDSLDFDQFSATGGMASVVFVLALVGFGAKVGFVPMHVWLPEAYPAAPSHASAVMSAVLVKTGIYGLIRILEILGPPRAWWGWTLVAIGLGSAVWGVLATLAQRDLKRLLAYSSVENLGVIAAGIGTGVLGIAYANGALAVLGFAAALMHVLNHALTKGLLFLAVGAIEHATGTRQIDRLGGLQRRMPTTGSTFILGATSIAGLPPLGCFAAELLLYLAAFGSLIDRQSGGLGVLGLLVLTALGLIGGLAAIAFTKAVGIGLLGEPRSEEASHAVEVPRGMRWPMVGLAITCVAAAFEGPRLLEALSPAIERLLPLAIDAGVVRGFEIGLDGLAAVRLAWVVLGTLVVLLTLVRRRLYRDRTVGASPTWDCGYTAGTPRIQYTGSSLVEPAVRLFRLLLWPREATEKSADLFPSGWRLQTSLPDLFVEKLFRPVFGRIAWFADRLHAFQQGRIQLYVLYIAIVTLVLLIWKLG